MIGSEGNDMLERMWTIRVFVIVIVLFFLQCLLVVLHCCVEACRIIFIF